MLKHFIIRNLHRALGFENYLFVFSIFKIKTLSADKRKKEFVYFSKLFSTDSNILILGANTGITTIPVAKNVIDGKVFAIEPVPDNYSILLKIIKYFNRKNVFPMKFALGNENKIIEMILPIINNTKSHGLAYVKDDTVKGFDEGIKYNIELKRLDDIEIINNIRIDGIKIVAENYEKFIFEGGINLIKKNMPIIYCELWFNENRLKTLELIKSWGYEIKVLKEGKLEKYNPEIHITKNLFFVPFVNS